jgi:hypothetical protein
MKRKTYLITLVGSVLISAVMVTTFATVRSRERTIRFAPPLTNFTPTCSSPSFPAPAPAVPLGIDQGCGLEGSGGAEAAQNSAKNNFCAGGTAQSMTIADLRGLQSQVISNSTINFGDQNTAGRHKGPTTDRGPLKQLGEDKLVTLKAFILIARQEGKESVNCGTNVSNTPAFHDIHISLVESGATTDECSSVVAEMSPHHRPTQWTAPNLMKVANAHAMVRVTGHLFFDSSHVPCDSDTPVRTNPKRSSLWEVHPIYKFEVCTANCDGEGTWQTLDLWLQTH